jgi:GNAT superfamily N-acetyltransferase
MAYARLQTNVIGLVITLLEMTERPPQRPFPSRGLKFIRWHDPDIKGYRALFRKIGQHWLWFERLLESDDELAAIIGDSRQEVYRITDKKGTEVGMLELDLRTDGQCLLAYVGLLPELTGKGHGRWVLDEAVRLAWREGVSVIRLTTCTLDHPAALKAYLRAGFRVYGRAVGTFVDPRLRGILPLHAAPQIPVLTVQPEQSLKPD